MKGSACRVAGAKLRPLSSVCNVAFVVAWRVRSDRLGPAEQLYRATTSEMSYSRLSFCPRGRLMFTEKHFVPPERS
jgi:hypothetical protein